MELVESKTWEDSRFQDYEFNITRAFLSAKGLDTVLKMQEHEDNKNRFKKQNRLNQALKRNSNFSLSFSFLAIVFAIIGSIFSFERLEISKKRLAMDEANQKQLIVSVEKNPATAQVNKL